MITKNKIRLKMTVVPMVIFVISLALLKFGFAPAVMENKAEASILNPQEAAPRQTDMGLFTAIQDWRASKIIRTSLHYNPATFYELSSQDIQKLFGVPHLYREDGQARMMQYATSGCVADFYFLADKDGKIAHYEIRQLENNTSADCLYDLLENL